MGSLISSEPFDMAKAADIPPESPRAKSPSWLLFNEFFTNRAIREADLELPNEMVPKGAQGLEISKKSSQSHVKKAGEVAPLLPTWSELLAFSDLEERSEQSRLVAAISEHFMTPGHFCAEAPTGIGKTFAYLYPAIITALQTGKQVCVSTNTKNLQDQIETKDFPKITSLFGKAGISGLRLQKLKGRKNYLSVLKYFEFFDQDELSDTAAILATKIGFWMLTTKSGELDELSLYGEEYTLIEDIHAGDLRVLTPDNSYREFEYLERARLGVKRAQIIVVNHALLLSEYLEEGESNILPKIEFVVLDEVHNLEAVATDALKMSSDFMFFEKSMHDIVRIIKKHNKLRPLEAFLSPEVTALSESLLMTARILFDEIESVFTFVQPPSKNGYS
jgi:Rad3-related DNA helicase